MRGVVRLLRTLLTGVMAIMVGIPVMLLGLYAYVVTVGIQSDLVPVSPPVGATTVLLERRAISPFGLAEYNRFVILERDGRRLARFRLMVDHGGLVEMNAFLDGADRLLLVDHVDSYLFDLRRGANLSDGPGLLRDCGAGRPGAMAGARFLGRFDGRGAPFRFIPATEQPEVAIPLDCF